MSPTMIGLLGLAALVLLIFSRGSCWFNEFIARTKYFLA